MYEELVALLRKKYNKAPMVMEAADAIEDMSKLAEAIPHKCKCCIGCEIEQGDGGCETGFVLSLEKSKAYIEENLDGWRKFRALMNAMGTPIPEPPKEDRHMADERLALAMLAGARAIEQNPRKYFGTTLVHDAFGDNPKKIEYCDAAKMLRAEAEAVLEKDG